ncbi:MAG: hypothetical protein KDF60_15495 [Calditrichaeota bacterium]|nr:hypothetical protein [Calditrichota bacterium]
MKKVILVPLFLTFFVCTLSAQIRVAVSDFNNQTDILFLDGWERSVPDLLRANLSSINEITVLDRSRLDKVLEEQALSLSGLTDSTSIQEIGKLAGAEFILSGNVDRQAGEYVISADLIRVKTGQIQTEIVRSADRDYLDDMIEMLANNIIFRLTGKGAYKNKETFTSNSLWYWSGATILFGTAAFITNTNYKSNLEKYDSATELKDFEKFYDKANDSRNLYSTFAILGGAALIVTIIDLIDGSVENEISSGRSANVLLNNSIKLTSNDEIVFNVQINF